MNGELTVVLRLFGENHDRCVLFRGLGISHLCLSDPDYWRIGANRYYSSFPNSFALRIYCRTPPRYPISHLFVCKQTKIDRTNYLGTGADRTRWDSYHMAVSMDQNRIQWCRHSSESVAALNPEWEESQPKFRPRLGCPSRCRFLQISPRIHELRSSMKLSQAYVFAFWSSSHLQL
ncbi:hypothetical protein K474DRAFT_1037433 [Panus rudis PR-1116 ss-1]|nr:hypothetical protein K474DRAFT_1037433 [Panus rudis PR-1116 ss-1]